MFASFIYFGSNIFQNETRCDQWNHFRTPHHDILLADIWGQNPSENGICWVWSRIPMGIADDCLCHITILLEANKGCTHKKLHQSSISRRYLPKNPPSVADDNSIQKKKSAGLNSFKIHVGQLFWYQWSRKWSSQFIVYIYKTIKKSAFNPYTIHFQGLSILTYTTLFPHAKVLPPSYKLVKKPSSRYES